MAAQPLLRLLYHPHFRRVIDDLLEKYWSTSVPLDLGVWKSRQRWLSPANDPLVSPDPFPGRAPTRITHRVPLYGGTTARFTPVVVELPRAKQLFRFSNEQELPYVLPNTTIRVPRSPRRYLQHPAGIPASEMVFRQPFGAPTSGPFGPREAHTPRKDSKISHLYRRTLSLVNRTYGQADEYFELLAAYQQHFPDVEAMLTQIAFNQAIDRAMGYRARALKQHVYSKEWYNLPVGLDFLTSPGFR